MDDNSQNVKSDINLSQASAAVDSSAVKSEDTTPDFDIQPTNQNDSVQKKVLELIPSKKEGFDELASSKSSMGIGPPVVNQRGKKSMNEILYAGMIIMILSFLITAYKLLAG